ncbi:gamma-glutamyltransferase 2 [Paraburkholderia fungorum]|jgi:gamma-glutamyltranspeptidase/glutathione hydrolase|uniref:gamma-glutamyltransferase family protein n=1 Tax=Paraburkholderia fungorum TaxID=134537 RepID=UPI000D066783|nr:gamma-glutamyltransferase family protein [Paraburkholderia fungorum]PRZ55840.1 gamma-glutamyltransferase 2 [Paraburkholderia fungorum]
MNIELPYSSGRQPVLGRNVVSTSQPLAAQAGAAAFLRGGNAVDAALAAAITLTVVEPVMNGIGGDAFALVWDGQRLNGLNSSGRSPAAWTPERFKGLEAMPMRGWESVTVPGQVAGWVALSERFGLLPFEDLFLDAIRHARDGFPVSPVISRQWEQSVRDLYTYPGFTEFMPGGRAPKAGETWRFEAQAQTLEDIARTNGESFYRGRLAQSICDFAKEHGAVLDIKDLANHEAEWVTPISTAFRGHEIHEIPPNGQGLAALIAIGLLEQLPLEEFKKGSATRMHLEIEAMRLAFADLQAYVADPAHMMVRASDLLDTEYLKHRAKEIDFRRAGNPGPGKPTSGGTVYLCAADSNGMMVSFIQSNYRGFGSGVVVPNTGISLHNRGSGFVTTPGHANQVDGSKKPLHSIIPAFMTKGGKPLMAFGVMGGNMQAQGHTQMVMRRVLEGDNPQACSDAPRWRINDNAELTLEPTVCSSVAEELQAMGHTPTVLEFNNLDFGSAQLIEKLPAEGRLAAYVAGSDHRRDGQAVAC